MNKPIPSIERLLEKSAQSLALSASEKTLAREELHAFLQKNPLPKNNKASVPGFIFALRSSVAFILIVLVGGGVASAAEHALPGHALYPLKTKVTEPVRAMLSFDPQARSEFEIERVHRRLQEYAQLAAKHTEEDASEELARSLTAHVERAKEAIADLSADGEEPGALVAAHDLRVTLLAHAEVLETLDEQEQNTNIESDSLERALEVAIVESEHIASSSEAVLSSASDEELAKAVQEQEADAYELVDTIANELTQASEAFDVQDAQETKEQLAQASVLIEAAKNAQASGEFAEALLLFSDAHEKLGELTIIIEADSELGIDVIKENEE